MRAVLLTLLCLLLSGAAAAAGEPDINGLWQGSLYGSDVQAEVKQDVHDVHVEAVVHDLAGGTNVYHLIGIIENGHIILLHGSGHRFEGDAKNGEIVGVLTTKGGSRLELKASRAPGQPDGQGSMGRGPTAGRHRPG